MEINNGLYQIRDLYYEDAEALREFIREDSSSYLAYAEDDEFEIRKSIDYLRSCYETSEGPYVFSCLQGEKVVGYVEIRVTDEGLFLHLSPSLNSDREMLFDLLKEYYDDLGAGVLRGEWES